MPDSLKKLRPPNLSDNAYGRLERMLVTLEIAPGAELTERELISRVHMGRTPVREAMQRLAWMGMIEIRPRAGLRITAIRPGDFQRVQNLRSLLEPIFARTATERASPGQRAQIAACRDMMQEAVAMSDVKLFLAADKVFDRLMAESAADEFLVRALDPLQVHARRLWFHHVGQGGLVRAASLHMPVMDAFVAANAGSAEAAMRALIDGIAEGAGSDQ